MMSAREKGNEDDIIGRCLKGRREEYALLVDRHKDMAFNIAYRMLGDEDAAKDMAQESFIAAYAGLKEFRREAQFSSWLCRIIINKCKDFLKSRHETVDLQDVEEIIPARTRTPEQAVCANQSGDLIQKALARLPVDYRTVIVLKHMEELSYDEIAGILGVSVPALKVRAHRGREMLKQVLESMGVGACNRSRERTGNSFTVFLMVTQFPGSSGNCWAESRRTPLCRKNSIPLSARSAQLRPPNERRRPRSLRPKS
jgi:RNA polymerase sigma-70 factor (ECF subfamily)